jgi:hypothetical protein
MKQPPACCCCCWLRCRANSLLRVLGFCLLAAGGTAQEVGGPLDKDGSVGHKFTTDGGIGETPLHMLYSTMVGILHTVQFWFEGEMGDGLPL